jgi:hypothetical protein
MLSLGAMMMIPHDFESCWFAWALRGLHLAGELAVLGIAGGFTLPLDAGCQMGA